MHKGTIRFLINSYSAELFLFVWPLSIQVCKYASMHVYASMQVCTYASMHKYARMQVIKYKLMEVWKYTHVYIKS